MSLKNHLGRIAAAAGIAATAVLASCGGGTYQVNTFKPTRIVSFGDESSMLSGAQGLKYSINGLNSNGQIDCSVNPIWTQRLAANYGLVYSNCNVDAAVSTNAVDKATLNATVSDVTDQISSLETLEPFTSGDMVAIWVGMHDVINEYNTNGTGADESTPIGNMRTAGQALGDLINHIVASGAKVVVLTIPDMSESPFGYTEAQRGDFDRAKLLSDMSTAFNLGMRGRIVNDGSKIALVTVDDYIYNAVRSPGSYGFISVPDHSYGCNLAVAPLPLCTTSTLNADPSTGLAATSNFLWADATHLGASAQTYIGNQAVSRATSNPF